MTNRDQQEAGDYNWGLFDGYQQLKWTPIPDEFFDRQMTELSDGELRALLYVLRKTLGWKKDADTISLEQMLHGQKAQDGSRIDRGAGVSKPVLLAALRGLEAKGLIVRERRMDEKHGNLPTSYRLRLQGTLGKEIDPSPLVKKPALPLVKNPTTQETVLQETMNTTNNPPVVVVQSSDTHRDDDGAQEPDEQPVPTRVQRTVALLSEPPEDAWWYAELAAEYPQLKIDQEAQACKDHHCKHGNGTSPSFTWKPALSDWLWRSAHPKSRRNGQPAAGNGARPGSRSAAPAEPPRLPERSVPLWNKVQYAVYHEVGARSWEEHAWAQVDLIKPEGGGKLLMQAPARHREYYERKCDMVQRLLDEAMPGTLHLRVQWDYT